MRTGCGANKRREPTIRTAPIPGNARVGGHDSDVITNAEVMPLLLEACPSFGVEWPSIEAANRNEGSPAGRLGYLDAGDFIRHLVRLRLSGQTEDFPAVFAVIERMGLEGDPYVRELAVIGYLEGMQMVTVTDAGLDPEADFRPYCTPILDGWWDRVNRFWAGGATALRDPDPEG
jgi:hypothetical protein